MVNSVYIDETKKEKEAHVKNIFGLSITDHVKIQNSKARFKEFVILGESGYG